MKILWLSNIILPKASAKLNLHSVNVGGWIVGLNDDISKNDDIELYVCSLSTQVNEIKMIKLDNCIQYIVPQKNKNISFYNKELEGYFKKIIELVNPDLIHIFGTEYPHSLAMVNVCHNVKKVISIQGLVSVYAEHYLADLPYDVVKRETFRDIIKSDSLINQRQKFMDKGKFELEALRNVEHVIGRTNWDRACVEQINPKAKYYFCNETLRSEFYNHNWDINKCEKYSIFISQGYYPIKGLHIMLKAMPEILKKFPQTHLYVAGLDITKYSTLKEKIRISSYGFYLRNLIKQNDLEDKITFTGALDEKAMCERFLKSNVFVLPSTIENSPNSLGEAMILGVPCVASYVGGVPDLLDSKIEGFLYQHDAHYMLAYYVNKIFINKESFIDSMSENARKRAKINHNKIDNANRMAEIYRTILY